ncbi:MAG TPA: hypothetical protein VHC90_05665 [Bryobacteraceae bacterium]|nr:hypothetical protein [Bryobacteraceae bacterium]
MSWLETGSILIGKPHSEHVSINIVDRDDKEGWLSGTLDVRAGAWGGNCRAWFHRGELRQLASELENLYRDLVGPSQFTPMEPYLEMKFTGNGRGSITVDGIARDDENHLTFRLELDQTELPQIIKSLELADPI